MAANSRERRDFACCSFKARDLVCHSAPHRMARAKPMVPAQTDGGGGVCRWAEESVMHGDHATRRSSRVDLTMLLIWA